MATPIPNNRATFTLDEIVAATGGVRVGDATGDRSVCGVSIDSRTVEPGSLFVAVRGENQDGARFLPDAVARGAGALLVARGDAVAGTASIEVDDTTRALGDLAAYHRKRWGGVVVAITGSAGKTTTKELTAGALSALDRRVHKTVGNLNNQFGVPMTLFQVGLEHDTAVLELGTSGVGEIARLGEIARPDVAIVLLAALAHTAGIGTLAEVADEKASLWRSLDARGTAIVNADDSELTLRLRKDVSTLSFGSVSGAQVRLLDAKLTAGGTEARIAVHGAGELTLTLRLLGHAAALDSCAAIAAAIALRGQLGLSETVQRACRGIAEVEPTAGRMARHATKAGVTICDDSYNANPSSLALALESVRAIAEALNGRAIAVLADMKELGSYSQAEHARAGELAVKLGFDVLVGCGPEMAHATSAAARLAAGRLAVHHTRIAHVLEPLDAVPIVQSFCRKGDVVLVKGSRSMAMERVVAALSERFGGAA
jgi:UDP-N-acetylmuramoyl-tripeptide--D-alanyl-D-alanine ligase